MSCYDLINISDPCGEDDIIITDKEVLLYPIGIYDIVRNATKPTDLDSFTLKDPSILGVKAVLVSNKSFNSGYTSEFDAEAGYAKFTHNGNFRISVNSDTVDFVQRLANTGAAVAVNTNKGPRFYGLGRGIYFNASESTSENDGRTVLEGASLDTDTEKFAPSFYVPDPVAITDPWGDLQSKTSAP